MYAYKDNFITQAKSNWSWIPCNQLNLNVNFSKSILNVLTYFL